MPASAKQLLVEEWSISDKFSMPESAAYDEIGEQIFVSNVNEYAKDGNGFVSKVSADGLDIELQWLSGLNSPTGLAVHDRLLYVVDFDELVVVDIDQRRIIKKVPAPDKKPSLNDVAISDSGQVFVSGSSSNSIYELKRDQLEVWKHDDSLLKHANGLIVKDNKLIYGGLNWLVFDLTSKQLVDGFKQPTPAIQEIDGITPDGCNGYFITLLDDQRIWRVGSSGRASAVSDLALNGIDIDHRQSKLYVPTVGGGLSVFKIAGTCE